jgi:hypothetical protein
MKNVHDDSYTKLQRVTTLARLAVVAKPTMHRIARHLKLVQQMDRIESMDRMAMRRRVA